MFAFFQPAAAQRTASDTPYSKFFNFLSSSTGWMAAGAKRISSRLAYGVLVTAAIISSKSFGDGVFGGSHCTLNYHIGVQPNDCVLNYLNTNVLNGYGTVVDVVATTCLSFVGCLSLSLSCCVFTSIFCNSRNSGNNSRHDSYDRFGQVPLEEVVPAGESDNRIVAWVWWA